MFVAFYKVEKWNMKKAEKAKILTYEVWCWRITFKIPWTEKVKMLRFLKE